MVLWLYGGSAVLLGMAQGVAEAPSAREAATTSTARFDVVHPIFKEDARGRHVYPAYGCQMFYVSKEVIPELCQRMRESMFPRGLDRWFFASQWVEDERWAFTSRSLGGQWYGDSDSWGPGGNQNVGFVEEPPPKENIYIRRMSDASLIGVRKWVWQKHRRADAISRQNSAFGRREDLASWIETPPSMPPPRPPIDPEAIAAATPKAWPAERPTQSSDESVAAGFSDSAEFDAWKFLPTSSSGRVKAAPANPKPKSFPAAAGPPSPTRSSRPRRGN